MEQLLLFATDVKEGFVMETLKWTCLSQAQSCAWSNIVEVTSAL